MSRRNNRIRTVIFRVLPLLGFISLAAACSRDHDDPAPEKPTTDESKELSATHSPDRAVASSDGVIIFYDDRGAGDETIVFVHGWNCDREYWQLQRDYFAENYRVISVDLAGHGESAQNREQWSISAFGDDVSAVVKKLDLKNITLVGHSLGGLVVLAAALELGERVERVVGVDTWREIDTRIPDEQLQEFVAALEQDYENTVTGLVSAMFIETSHARVRDFVVRDMASAPKDASIGSLLAYAEYDALAAIDALKVPLALINSDYQPTNVELLEQHADDFTFVEVSGVGHFVMLEDPVTFTDQLNALLN